MVISFIFTILGVLITLSITSLATVKNQAGIDVFQVLLEKILVISLISVIIAGINMFSIIKQFLKPLKLFFKKFALGTRGDLTVNMEIETRDEMGYLSEHFNVFFNKLKKTIKIMSDDGNALANFSDNLSGNIQETTKTITEINSSSESILTSIQEQKENVLHSSKNIEAILEAIANINQVTGEMKNHLSQSTDAIEEMASNINRSADMAIAADRSSETL